MPRHARFVDRSPFGMRPVTDASTAATRWAAPEFIDVRWMSSRDHSSHALPARYAAHSTKERRLHSREPSSSKTRCTLTPRNSVHTPAARLKPQIGGWKNSHISLSSPQPPPSNRRHKPSATARLRISTLTKSTSAQPKKVIRARPFARRHRRARARVRRATGLAWWHSDPPVLSPRDGSGPARTHETVGEWMDPPCTDRVTHGPDDPDPPTCGGDSAFSGTRFSTAYGVACSKLFRAALPSRSSLRKLGAVERPGRLWQRSSRSSSLAHCCEESAASDPSAIRTPASGASPCNGTDGCEQRVRSPWPSAFGSPNTPDRPDDCNSTRRPGSTHAVLSRRCLAECPT